VAVKVVTACTRTLDSLGALENEEERELRLTWLNVIDVGPESRGNSLLCPPRD